MFFIYIYEQYLVLSFTCFLYIYHTNGVLIYLPFCNFSLSLVLLFLSTVQVDIIYSHTVFYLPTFSSFKGPWASCGVSLSSFPNEEFAKHDSG